MGGSQGPSGLSSSPVPGIVHDSRDCPRVGSERGRTVLLTKRKPQAYCNRNAKQKRTCNRTRNATYRALLFYNRRMHIHLHLHALYTNVHHTYTHIYACVYMHIQMRILCVCLSTSILGQYEKVQDNVTGMPSHAQFCYIMKPAHAHVLYYILQHVFTAC